MDERSLQERLEGSLKQCILFSNIFQTVLHTQIQLVQPGLYI